MMLVQAAVILHWISTGLELCLLGKLIANGIGKRTPFFCALIGFDAIASIPLAFISIKSALYFTAWRWKQPFMMLGLGMAGYETCRALAESYKGFRGTGRILAGICFAAGLLASAAATLPDLLNGRTLAGWQIFSIARRGEGLAIASSMLVAAILFAIVPAPVRANSKTHANVFAAFVSIDVIGYIDFRGAFVAWAQVLVPLAYLGCFIAWGILLTPAGETLVSSRYVSREDGIVAADKAERLLKGVIRDL